MASFGAIHDLADVEIRIRRILQAAAHEIHCGRQLLEADETLAGEKHEQLSEMLFRASEAIKRVIGD